MLASLHVADVGLINSFRLATPKPASVPGLRDARTGLSARFNSSVVPDVAFGRVMMTAFWDAEVWLDRFLESDHRVAAMLAGGLTIRMVPLRAHGAWPGFPDGLAEAEADRYEGPVIVTTLGLLKLRRSMAWNRASKEVQRQFLDAEGVIWAMGMSRPPLFAATVSMWESAKFATGFAIESGGAHLRAVEENEAGPFMRQEIFARFRPIASHGTLGPDPALGADWLTEAGPDV